MPPRKPFSRRKTPRVALSHTGTVLISLYADANDNGYKDGDESWVQSAYFWVQEVRVHDFYIYSSDLIASLYPDAVAKVQVQLDAGAASLLRKDHQIPALRRAARSAPKHVKPARPTR